MHPVLALADRLWALDVPTPAVIAQLVGVPLELYEDKFGFQRRRGVHPLGALDAGWRELGGYGYVRLTFAQPIDGDAIGYRERYGFRDSCDLNPNSGPSGVDSDIYKRANGRVDMWWPAPHLSRQSLGFTVNYGPPERIFLPSYDRADEVLEYSPRRNFAKVHARAQQDLVLGAFVREGAKLAGVYASPGGPVLFLDDTRVAVGFGRAQVTATNFVFRVVVDGREKIVLPYAERYGIGANPYDREQADIDLFALIARGVARPEWWAAYTKPWTP